jgi:hypothetical protein
MAFLRIVIPRYRCLSVISAPAHGVVASAFVRIML